MSEAEKTITPSYLDYFYNACEKCGEFCGETTAYILNNTSFFFKNTSYYLGIGYEGFKKGNDAYFNEVTPAFNDAYKNITELYQECKKEVKEEEKTN